MLLHTFGESQFLAELPAALVDSANLMQVTPFCFKNCWWEN